MVVADELSTEKLRFILTCQMFGFGKTLIGMRYKEMHNSPQFAPFKQKLLEIAGGQQHLVDEVFGVQYIYLDLRYISQRNMSQLPCWKYWVN